MMLTVNLGVSRPDLLNAPYRMEQYLDTEPLIGGRGDVDANWSTPGNWLETVTPFDGVHLNFDTATVGFANSTDSFNPVNDLTDREVDTFTVNDQSASNNFRLSGNAIGVAGGVTIDGDRSGSPSPRMGLAGMTLLASQTIDVNMQYPTWKTQVDIQSHTLTFQGFDTFV